MSSYLRTWSKSQGHHIEERVQFLSTARATSPYWGVVFAGMILMELVKKGKDCTNCISVHDTSQVVDEFRVDNGGNKLDQCRSWVFITDAAYSHM